MPKRRTKPTAAPVALAPTLSIAGEAAPQLAAALIDFEIRRALALQLRFLKISESMGNDDSKVVDADSVD